jgi:hypothetical protein
VNEPRSYRTIVAACAAALLLLLGGACSNAKGGKPFYVGFTEIERQLGHKPAQPAASLGARLIHAAILARSSTTSAFAGRTAAASYNWRTAVVLVRQGRPAVGWTLHGSVTRGDATFETRPDGSEVALLPQVGKSSASALLLTSGWLIEVEMAPASPSAGPVLISDVRTFVDALEL